MTSDQWRRPLSSLPAWTLSMGVFLELVACSLEPAYWLPLRFSIGMGNGASNGAETLIREEFYRRGHRQHGFLYERFCQAFGRH